MELAVEVQHESDRRVIDGEVYCDFCNLNYTERDEEGGVLANLGAIGVRAEGCNGETVTYLDSQPLWAIGPCCAHRLDGLDVNVAHCPEGESFADWIRRTRKTADAFLADLGNERGTA